MYQNRDVMSVEQQKHALFQLAAMTNSEVVMQQLYYGKLDAKAYFAHAPEDCVTGIFGPDVLRKLFYLYTGKEQITVEIHEGITLNYSWNDENKVWLLGESDSSKVLLSENGANVISHK